jgi:hypothetical protein
MPSGCWEKCKRAAKHSHVIAQSHSLREESHRRAPWRRNRRSAGSRLDRLDRHVLNGRRSEQHLKEAWSNDKAAVMGNLGEELTPRAPIHVKY